MDDQDNNFLPGQEQIDEFSPADADENEGTCSAEFYSPLPLQDEAIGNSEISIQVSDNLSQEFEDETLKRRFCDINEVFRDISDRNNPSSRSIFIFIRGRLSQYGLLQRYDEVAIIQEVYFRTIAKLLEGREITNPQGWIRSVAFRYIKELSRNHRHDIHLDNSLLEILAPENGVDQEFLTDEMMKVRQALQELSPEEKLLLQLKIVEGLSWTSIKDMWIERGYGDITLVNLRQRKSRALSHLRIVYHSL